MLFRSEKVILELVEQADPQVYIIIFNRREEVIQCFPSSIRQPGPAFEEFGWAVESETFPIFAKLVHLPEYAEPVVLGLVTSVGGVTERLVRQSSLSLFKVKSPLLQCKSLSVSVSR